MADNYKILIDKLDEFTRKYYKNQLLRGAIYTVGICVAFFIGILLLEYIGRFGVIGRTVLFYSFIATLVLVGYKYIVTPLLKLNRLGKVISNNEAAVIIGKHFTNIKDKLLNVLQLNTVANNYGLSAELIRAGIDQKITELRPVPFTNAVDFGENKKYVKYAALPLLLLLLLGIIFPSLVKETSSRLIRYNEVIVPVAPFKFEVLNKNLTVLQNKDFELDLKLTGTQIPDEVFVQVAGVNYKMEKNKVNSFKHIFRNVQKDITFTLAGAGYNSATYTLKVIPNPVILNFSVMLNYPAYTNKPDEIIKNSGDFIVPEGTKVSWAFNTQNTDKLILLFNDSINKTIEVKQGNIFAFEQNLRRSLRYSITSANKFVNNKDSVSYTIAVIPDQYPAIDVQEQKDSLNPNTFFFSGLIKDDYGFSRLLFKYTTVDADNKPIGATKQLEVPYNRGTNSSEYYYLWNINTAEIPAGQSIEYYFEVYDNDGVNGAKPARTVKMVYKVPTAAELAEKKDKASDEIKDNLSSSISMAKSLQKDLDDLNKKLLEKKNLTFEDKKKIQDILKKQNQLEDKIEEINKDNTSKNQMNNGEPLSEDEQRILDKQKELEDLMNEMMTPELKKLMDELEKLLGDLDKDKVQKMIDELKLSNKDLEKELDRSLEMFKRMEFEEKLTNTIDRLKDLAKEQDKLSSETKEGKTPDSELKDKQDKINEEFNKLQEDLKDLEDKNNELEDKMDFDNPVEDQKDIKDDLNKSKEDLNKGNKGKASQNQKNASQKMDKLSDKLKEMKDKNEEEQEGEDLDAIRQILENLVKLSFDQEELITTTSKTSTNSPNYNKLMQDQKRLKDNAKIIEDSLLALSKRQPQVSALINKEIGLINTNMKRAITQLEDRNVPMAGNRQQLVMTSINNLALMLSEVADQMKSNMMSNSPSSGSKSCKKPGKNPGGKPKAGDLKKMQDKLNKDLQDMKDGKNPGGKSGMSQGLARLAAQQEAIRREIQRLAGELGENGKNGEKGNLLKLAEEMEKNENDIVNKNITSETLKRNQDILTRLLDAENAEREREFDDKRESNEAKDTPLSNLAKFIEYNRLKNKETELLLSVPPSLNLFYRNKVSEYFNNYNNGKQPSNTNN